MRWITLLILTGTAALQAADLDEARITLSYQELQKLIAAARPAPSPVPLPATVLSADYTLSLESDQLTGKATYLVQTFEAGPHLIPLLGTKAKIISVTPADAVLVSRGDQYAILIEGKTRLPLALQIAVPIEESRSDWRTTFPIVPAALNSLHLAHLGEAYDFHVEKGVLKSHSPGAMEVELGALDTLTLTRTERPRASLAINNLPEVHVESPAIVRTATSEMKVVRDGSYLNATTWTIRHDAALNWSLTMPEGSQFLSCRIAGQPAAPLQQDAHTLIFPLPAPKDRAETTVELTYTGKQPPFAPVRGELLASLPSTALLVESLEWRITLPKPYETLAVQGNVDFQPSTDGAIRLSRELGRGDAPLIHVFYQKPETTK